MIENLEPRCYASVVTLTKDVKALVLVSNEVLHANGHTAQSVTGNNISNVAVDHLNVTGSSGDGVYIGGKCNNLSFTYVNAFNNADSGMQFYGNITNLYIGYSSAYNNPGIKNTSGPSGSGIILGNVHYATVEYTKTFANGKNNSASSGPVGLWAYESDHVLFSHDESYGNLTKNADGGGFDFDGGVTNSTMQYCSAHDNATYGFGAFTYTGSGPTANNKLIACTSTHDRTGINIWSGGPAITGLTLGLTVTNPTSGFAILDNVKGIDFSTIKFSSKNLYIYTLDFYGTVAKYLAR